ncbi:hypothetical protein SUNI508_06606 [Seiridium unicorne]|uniref:Uncharacterized protein n=1 Tax=Seiridium unicorne TaxID=138068 RepID=A0ABR2V069_9PEZI
MSTVETFVPVLRALRIEPVTPSHGKTTTSSGIRELRCLAPLYKENGIWNDPGYSIHQA